MLCVVVLCCVVLCCVVLCCVVLCCVVLCCVVLCCVVLCCIVLYCIVLYCIVLYCIAYRYVLGNSYTRTHIPILHEMYIALLKLPKKVYYYKYKLSLLLYNSQYWILTTCPIPFQIQCLYIGNVPVVLTACTLRGFYQQMVQHLVICSIVCLYGISN